MEPKETRNAILSLYPDALSNTHCVPPIHFNHVAYTRSTVAGQPVLILQRVPGALSHSQAGPAAVSPTTTATTSGTITTTMATALDCLSCPVESTSALSWSHGGTESPLPVTTAMLSMSSAASQCPSTITTSSSRVMSSDVRVSPSPASSGPHCKHCPPSSSSMSVAAFTSYTEVSAAPETKHVPSETPTTDRAGDYLKESFHVPIVTVTSGCTDSDTLCHHGLDSYDHKVSYFNTFHNHGLTSRHIISSISPATTVIPRTVVDLSPAGQFPTGQPTTGQSLTGQFPTGQSPVGQFPTGQSPIGQFPTGLSPTGQLPTGQSPTGQPPTGQFPTGQSPAGQSPNSQSPTGHCPSGQSPTGQSITGHPPTGQSPTDQSPTIGGQSPTDQSPTIGGQFPTGQPPTGQFPTSPPPTGQSPTDQSLTIVGQFPTGQSPTDLSPTIVGQSPTVQLSYSQSPIINQSNTTSDPPNFCVANNISLPRQSQRSTRRKKAKKNKVTASTQRCVAPVTPTIPTTIPTTTSTIPTTTPTIPCTTPTIPTTTTSIPSTTPTAQSAYSLWSVDRHGAKLATVQFNDAQEDFAQTHVMHNLRALGHHLGAAMFILSQYRFDDYLQKAAKKKSAERLVRPADLCTPYRRGDFDVLIIHRQLGVMVGEIKSVGFNLEIKSCQTQADDDVAMRLHKAADQLEKSETVLRCLLQDVASHLAVKKTVFLPYVNRTDLRRVLADRPDLRQALSKSLNVVSGSLDISQLFCCSDQLTHPSTFWDVGQSTLLRLEDWWRNVWKGWCPQSHLDEDVYLEVLGRFLGPASSVRIHCPVAPRLEVRTAGEAVSELGRRLSLLVLTPRQLDLLDKARPRVCVSGPPGTGKTVVVTVMGLKWLLEGNDVHVVSTRPASLAASRVVFHQLRLTRLTYSSHELGAVFFHHFDFYCQRQVQAAVEALTAAATARGGQLHVLMEEAVFSDSGSVLGPHYLHFIHVLLARVPALHLWVARVRHDKIPDVLEKEILTTPLRSAPAVLREVRPGVEQNAVHNYSDDLGVAAPSDGPQVMRLSHDGPAHSGVWPHNCPHCGLLLAQLFRHLHVGSSARMKPSRNSPDPLRYKDVFILTRSSDLQDDVTTHDASGLVTSPASGLVRGLREEGVPVRVLEESPPCGEGDKWRRAVEDTAEAGMDTVTVAHWRPVLGLERKLVVWLKGRAVKDDKNRDDVEVEMWDRLWVVSRCTTQLVVVDVPP